MSDTIIRHADFQVVRLPLQRPYAVSSVSQDHYNAVILRLTLESGETAFGEVVPLCGSSTETIESVTALAMELTPHLIGFEPNVSREIAHRILPRAPLAASLILTAIDHITLADSLASGCTAPVPLVASVSTVDEDLPQSVVRAAANGFRTVKVTVGASLDNDLAALPVLAESLPPEVKVRFDAGQAYTLREAVEFSQAAEKELHGRVEAIEQPLAAGSWDNLYALCQKSAAPVMLDESVVTREDIAHAAQIGCGWIKLKVCKHGGVKELLSLAQYAVDLGLKVAVGNSVATDISNVLEMFAYDCYHDLFTGACEATGFLRIKKPAGAFDLRLESGCAVW